MVYIYESMAVPVPDVSVVISPDLLLVGGADEVTLTCSTSLNQDIVDAGDLRYSFIWIDRDGSEVRNSSRSNINSSTTSNSSTLTLFPLSLMDTFFRCNVTISEAQNTLQKSDLASASIYINMLCKLYSIFIMSYNSNIYFIYSISS